MKATIFVGLVFIIGTVTAKCGWKGTAPSCGYGWNSYCPNGEEPHCIADSQSEVVII